MAIHRHFESQADKTPDAPALIGEFGSITYRALQERALELADILTARKIGNEAIVAIALPRSPEAVAAALACLTIGATYVPIGTAHPKTVIDHILADSCARIVICHSSDEHMYSIEALHVDRQQTNASDRRLRPSSKLYSPIACLLYTSGSTGLPKGVRCTHRGILQRCEATWASYPFRPTEIAIQNTLPTVIDSLWELWAPICRGIPVLQLEESVNLDAKELVRLLHAYNVTRLCLVPSLLRAILTTVPNLDQTLGKLRLCIASGEIITIDLVKLFHTKLPHAVLLNQYGLTETSADVTTFDTSTLPLHSSENDVTPVPVGKPFEHVEMYLLDERLDGVPDGTCGEIYVGGTCLADGYVHRPALTAERFIANPFRSGSTRMLRTGDIGRRLPSGDIVVTGRTDRQVKIRGYRVELDGIEAVLSQHPLIRAVAVEYQHNTGHRPKLIAFICLRAHETLAAETLRNYCKTTLNSFSVPQHFVFLQSMPRTASGKIDRTRLSSWKEVPRSSTPQRHSRSPHEAIRQVWCRVLNLVEAEDDDDFFHLGGDSLLLMTLIGEIRSVLNLELPLRHLLRHPTLGRLISIAELESKEGPPFNVRTSNNAVTLHSPEPMRLQTIPLSLSQIAIWTHEQLTDDANPYGTTVAATFFGTLDIPRFQQACEIVIRRNPILSMRVIVSDDGPKQHIADNDQRLIDISDARTVQFGDKQRYTNAHIQVVARSRMTGGRRGPIYIRAVILSTDEVLLIFQLHHLACDGPSLAIFFRQLSETYNALMDLCPIISQMEDRRFLAYCRIEDERMAILAQECRGRPRRQHAPAWQYWQSVLSRLEATQSLPCTRSGNDNRTSFVGLDVPIRLPRHDVTKRLARIKYAGVTAFHLFLASYSMALFRIFSYQRQAIAFPTSIRPAMCRDALGSYISLMPCILTVSESTTYVDHLLRVRELTWTMVEQPHGSFEEALHQLRSAGMVIPFRGFDTIISLDENSIEYLKLRALESKVHAVRTASSKYPLVLAIEASASDYQFAFEYRASLYTDESVSLLARSFLAEMDKFCVAAQSVRS